MADPIGQSGATTARQNAEFKLDASARRDMRAGLIAAGVFFGGLLGWGLLSRLDAVVYAPGQVVVAESRQSVQSREGGIVSQLLVREGQHVRSGQILLRLAGDEIRASERALATQVIDLQSQQAELAAETSDAAGVVAPASFAQLPEEDREIARQSIALQQRQFSDRRLAMRDQRGVLNQRILELRDQVEGRRRQLEANREQQRLIADELAGTKALLAKGFAPLTRVRALERSAADLRGSAGSLEADIAQAEQEMGETRIRITNLVSQRNAENSKAIQDAAARLGTLMPQLASAREQLARITVRSPATGHVVGLTAFTVGGVISPMQKIMEVVPDAGDTVIESRVKPSDVASLSVKAPVKVRLDGLGLRSTPIVTASIQVISADAFQDERTGAYYFKVRVVIPPSELDRIRAEYGPEAVLRPGYAVDMVVPLRRRNGLEFLIQPLQRSLWQTSLPKG